MSRHLLLGFTLTLVAAGCSSRGTNAGVQLDVKGPSAFRPGQALEYTVTVAPAPQDRPPFKGKVTVTVEAGGGLRATPAEWTVDLADGKQATSRFTATVAQAADAGQFTFVVRARPQGGRETWSEVTIRRQP
jgi:hypothetical protein